jgi:alpha-tubulin suppressor-like RCC1 family protein
MASSAGHQMSVILSDGSIMSAGYNATGELGLGHTNPVYDFTLVPSAGKNNVKVIHSGNRDGASYILKDNGELWVTGNAGYGMLGNGSTSGNVNTYRKLTDNVEDMSCSTYTLLVLKKDGTVWCLGSNNQGQLGLGNTSLRSVLTQITALGNDNAFVCAGQYSQSFVIKKDGRLFYAGDGSYNPGITSDTSDITTFTYVSNMGSDNLKVASSYGAIIMKKDGRIYSYGSNPQSGTSPSQAPRYAPELGTDNVDIGSAQYFFWVRKGNGEIWGTGPSYQNYIGFPSGPVYERSSLYTGNYKLFTANRTAEAVVAVEMSGRVVGTGSNSYGPLGLGHNGGVTGLTTLLNGRTDITGLGGITNEDTQFTEVLVSYSDDGIHFSEYVSFNSDDLPQARYLKFKVVLSGGVQEGEISTFEFDQSKPETTVEIDDFLESVGSNIRYKTLYNYPMTRDVSHADGELYEVTIDKTQWKKITKLLIK